MNLLCLLLWLYPYQHVTCLRIFYWLWLLLRVYTDVDKENNVYVHVYCFCPLVVFGHHCLWNITGCFLKPRTCLVFTRNFCGKQIKRISSFKIISDYCCPLDVERYYFPLFGARSIPSLKEFVPYFRCLYLVGLLILACHAGMLWEKNKSNFSVKIVHISVPCIKYTSIINIVLVQRNNTNLGIV